MEINEKAKVSLEIDDSEATTRFQEINTRLQEIRSNLKSIAASDMNENEKTEATKKLVLEQRALNGELKELKTFGLINRVQRTYAYRS